MADTVTTQVIYNGNQTYAVHITNECDGTGESGVVKVDISALISDNGATATYTTIEEISGQVAGFNYVKLAWDHTADDTIAVLSGPHYMDWRSLGGLTDPRTTGGTGDILLTTDGNFDGNSYDITIVLKLRS